LDYSKQVPAAGRLLQLLEALATAPDGLSAGELLEQLEIPRSALFALLNTLKSRHYVEQADGRGRYRLGPALWALLPGRQHGLGPLIDAFHGDAGLATSAETIALATLHQRETVIVAQKESAQAVRAVFQPGERRPASATAAGLVLLAGLSPARVVEMVQQPFAALEARLRAVQETAVAHSDDGQVVEIACPVCADGSRPVAALAAALPSYRAAADAVAELASGLQRAAARLSYRLGAPLYQPYGWAAGDPLGPSRALSRSEIEQFLQGSWGARLACIRHDGTPHVIPLWYAWDGTYVWTAASPGAFWKKHVAENPQVSLTVDEPWPPLRRAFVTGRAEWIDEAHIPGGLAGLRRLLARRYLGPGAEKRAEFQETEGWQAVRIVPASLSGCYGLGGGG
jgi:DNA-binding IclR family transcriptional regulator